MNLGEWRQVLATEPATPHQIGAIHRESARLGLDGRAGRLRGCAAILGLGDLESTRNLTMGEAGKLVRTLCEVRDLSELPATTAAADSGHQADDAGGAARVTGSGISREPARMSFGEALMWSVFLVIETRREWQASVRRCGPEVPGDGD